jgi:16S rRNA (guanine966-N2)-methyltransferase
LDGQRCLDLFSGSGALGFEAASRGADDVVMVESDPRAFAALVANRTRLGAERCRIERSDARKFAGGLHGAFDVIFLDPPFAGMPMGEALELARRGLKPGGLVYCESGQRPESWFGEAHAGAWQVLRQSKAGVVHFALLTPSEPSS